VVRGSDRHILVVDDDERIRKALSLTLSSAGYRVSSASTGMDGLMAVESGRVDLVLLDFNMPGLSGLDVLKTLRQKHTKLALPVILVTGRSDDADVLDALTSGANDYVTKPVVPLIFLARIATHLSMKVENDAFRNAADASIEIENLDVGVVLADRYEIISHISRGGFGDIFRAKQVSTGQDVAIKTIRNDRTGDGSSRGGNHQLRFETELRVLAQASHPHIVKLVDSGRLVDRTLFLVLDYIDGEPLHRFIQRRERITFSEAHRLMRQVLDALACAHGFGVIHSDVTPSNIMVSSTGMLSNAHVLDFGVVNLTQQSSLLDSSTVNDDGLIMGTPQYMAPEQIEFGSRTAQTDLFSWGLIFGECLLGRSMIPYKDVLNVRRFLRGCTSSVAGNFFGHKGLSQFLQQVTSIDPSKRFQSAEATLLALDEMVQSYQTDYPTSRAPPSVDSGALIAFDSDNRSSSDDLFGKTIVDQMNIYDDD
jgi:serine/threonine protein kinase/CheY-like chemotaxis protein